MYHEKIKSCHRITYPLFNVTELLIVIRDVGLVVKKFLGEGGRERYADMLILTKQPVSVDLKWISSVKLPKLEDGQCPLWR